MASCKSSSSRPRIPVQIGRCWSCEQNSGGAGFFKSGYSKGVVGCGSGVKRERRWAMVARGRGLNVNGFGVKCGSGGDEDKKFVEVLREAQPYIHLHRGSTFVVALSSEVIAGCRGLDTILKVFRYSFAFLLFNVLLGVKYQS